MSPNENIAAAQMAVAKAAGIISSNLVLAEYMLSKVKTLEKVAMKIAAANKTSREIVVAKKLEKRRRHQKNDRMLGIRELHG